VPSVIEYGPLTADPAIYLGSVIAQEFRAAVKELVSEMRKEEARYRTDFERISAQIADLRSAMEARAPSGYSHQVNATSTPAAPASHVGQIIGIVRERFAGVDGVAEAWVREDGSRFIVIGSARSDELATRAAVVTEEIITRLVPAADAFHGSYRWRSLRSTTGWRRAF
jgi:hypothetical protein